ncbi:MAG: DNA methyltransferase [Chloroflexi bacterium]|nr:DNA methyltransferase [Chloroflexota bacterium]
MAGKNWPSKVMWTEDCLYILRGMNSQSVDLIYLDPPFNSNADYAAPIGSQAAGAAFKDTWTLTDLDVEWINLIEARHSALYRALLAATTPSDKSYLVYMVARLLELRRVLKPNGSLYLHCDPTMSHYLKVLMDAIFGRHSFRNEIVWSYQRWTGAARHFQRMHDVVLYYAMPDATFNLLTEPYSPKSKHKRARRSAVNKEGQLEQWYTDDENRQKAMRDVWEISYLNSQAKERVGYPTQKPLALLDRIIKASSDPGDIVLDPFCGCATTCVAADDLGRDWIGIDISPKAAELVVRRIADRQGLFRDIIHREDIPTRTDLGKLPCYNSAENKQQLYGIQAGFCPGCGQHFQLRNLEVDHIISRGKGGTDHIENLQLLCGACNRVKGNRGMEYLRAKLQLP